MYLGCLQRARAGQDYLLLSFHYTISLSRPVKSLKREKIPRRRRVNASHSYIIRLPWFPILGLDFARSVSEIGSKAPRPVLPFLHHRPSSPRLRITSETPLQSIDLISSASRYITSRHADIIPRNLNVRASDPDPVHQDTSIIKPSTQSSRVSKDMSHIFY